MSIFDKDGYLEADALQDALNSLKSFSSVASSKRQRHPLSSYINPIRRNLDYQGIARRLLVIDELIIEPHYIICA